MRTIVAVFLVMAAIAGCSAPPPKPVAQPPQFSAPAKYDGPPWYRYESSAEENAKAEGAVRESLKDPESANFKGLYKISRGMSDDVICGQVNARNSYGGYVGFKAFYVKQDGEVRIAGKEFDTMLVSSYCVKPIAPTSP